MKKWKILEIIEGYQSNENVHEIEKRVDIVFLRRIMERFFVINAILIVIVGILVVLDARVRYRDREILDRIVSLKNGEITESVNLLKSETKYLSVSREELEKIKKERYYNTFTASICDYLSDSGVNVRFSNVKSILIAIDEVVPIYFPKGEYTPDDFYALAKVESNFIKTAIGTHGERGVFQILKWKNVLKSIGKPNASSFDVNVNTEMACFVLREKYQKYHKYKETLIAYNSYIIGTNGKLEEGYWKRFEVAKGIIKRLKRKAKEI